LIADGLPSQEGDRDDDVKEVPLDDTEYGISSKPLNKSRIALIISTIVMALILFICIIIYVVVFGSSLPPLEGSFTIHGISAPVTLTRDKFGVVHVEGITDEDVVFGQAFAHCQDRLWQMEFQRRLGKGRLSEVVRFKSSIRVGLFNAILDSLVKQQSTLIP